MYEKGENTCKELPREDKLDKKQEENKPINKVYNTFVSEETVISVSPEKTAAIEEGILIHDIFSNIYTAEDIDGVINMFKLKKGLHDDYVETLRKRVERIVYDERYSKYFDSKYSLNILNAIAGSVVVPDFEITFTEKSLVPRTSIKSFM